MSTPESSDKPQVVSPGRQPIFAIEPGLPEILQNVPQSLVTDMVMMVRRGLAAEKFIRQNGESEALAAEHTTAVVRLTSTSAQFLREYIRRMIATKSEIKAEMGAIALVALQEFDATGFEKEVGKLEKVPKITEMAEMIRAYMHRATQKVESPIVATEGTEEDLERAKPKVTVAGELVRLSKMQCHEEASLLAKAMLIDEPEQRDKYLKRMALLRNHERGERRGKSEADPEIVHATYNANPSSVLYATCAKAIALRAKSSDTADRIRLADAQLAISGYERAMQVQDDHVSKVTSSCTKDIAALKALVTQLETAIAKAEKRRSGE